VSKEPVETAYELRAPSTVRRALSESLPEAVAAAAYEFITGPLLDPHRIGKQLLPPMTTGLARVVVLTASSTGSTTRLA
jgi:mRNA interferase RelE/StbE